MTTRASPNTSAFGRISLTRVSGPQHTLVLMRHAKSDYPPGVADHDRPLAPRGIREAGLAGDWLRANTPAIDAVLCSTATRARQTLAADRDRRAGAIHRAPLRRRPPGR